MTKQTIFSKICVKYQTCFISFDWMES